MNLRHHAHYRANSAPIREAQFFLRWHERRYKKRDKEIEGIGTFLEAKSIEKRATLSIILDL